MHVEAVTVLIGEHDRTASRATNRATMKIDRPVVVIDTISNGGTRIIDFGASYCRIQLYEDQGALPSEAPASWFDAGAQAGPGWLSRQLLIMAQAAGPPAAPLAPDR